MGMTSAYAETGGVEDADLWCLQFGLPRPATVVCDDRVSLPHQSQELDRTVPIPERTRHRAVAAPVRK
ncbi:hypothetical protein CBM2586_B90001 [Cupriavidus phytorum]|uniref:Uncharacterized protein n=1 Tax=Cupriavidus taiwanensis TaxID=164546 RepID=A0A976ABQ3_9BURK|nr:hypothetical protein CBM2586_B90001 [Cupriavidus taiwanensis]